MAFTVVLTQLAELSETLARRTLSRVFSSWSFNNLLEQVVNVAYGQTVQLPAFTMYQFSADPLATVVVGWVFNANTVEIPLNQLTVIQPPATPYLRNTSTVSASNPVPVQVLAFS
jgi:hypothetical protein